MNMYLYSGSVIAVQNVTKLFNIENKRQKKKSNRLLVFKSMLIFLLAYTTKCVSYLNVLSLETHFLYQVHILNSNKSSLNRVNRSRCLCSSSRTFHRCVGPAAQRTHAHTHAAYGSNKI